MQTFKPGKQSKKLNNVFALPSHDGATIDAPKRLKGDALAWWAELSPDLIASGHLTNRTRNAMAEYCRCLVRLDEAEAKISADGLLVDGRADTAVKHPALVAVKLYGDRCQKYEILFGLTPASFAALPKAEKPAVKPWAKQKKAG